MKKLISHERYLVSFTAMSDLVVADAKRFGVIIPNDFEFYVDKETKLLTYVWYHDKEVE